MRALGGGKRLRPFLVVESAALFGVAQEAALHAGCALECIHCYSLVHDDLPAMDNDDLRRGRPTVHKAFDEATAILAGDALLTLRLRHPVASADASRSADAHRAGAELARAAGIGGMAGGQLLDLAAEGRFEKKRAQTQQRDRDVAIDEDRRAAAFRLHRRRDPRQGRRRCAQAARRLWRGDRPAFQIADDLLDLESDAATLGKATGKDAAAGKATLVSALGPEGARKRLGELVAQAETALAPFGAKADTLRMTAHFIAERRT